MKTLSTLLLGFLLLCSCSQEQVDEKIEQKGEMIFNLSLSNENGQLREALAIPAGSYLQINIETLEGEKILDNEHIEILSFNGNYVSEALKLDIADYILTEFLVISPENEVLYATPISGSVMADLVGHSLPLPFKIEENSSVQLPLEVINVSLLLPQDIGYVSFPFSVKEFFFLNVFKLDEKGNSLTFAKAFIIQNEDTIKQINIKPDINTVGLSNIGNEAFTLVIIKNGYTKHSENLTIERIFNTRENGLLNIRLEPALTFIAFQQPYYDSHEKFDFEFDLSFQGEIKVNWGDGQIETITSSTNNRLAINHKFGDKKHYFVSVSGEIDKIKEFISFYGIGPIKEIHLSNLPNLESFLNGYTGVNMSPRVLDFSHNPKLNFIELSNNSSIEKIILKDNNKVDHISLGDNYQMTTASLDEIINPIYNSVIESSRMDGLINLANFPDAEEPTVGPPSAGAWTKLAVLENDYNWTIRFIFDDDY